MDKHAWQDTPAQKTSVDHNDDTDSRLVRSIVQGDKESFTAIVERYTPLFYSLLKRMGPDASPENIEDDLQEIFLRIYRALPTFHEGSSFFSWAYTIAMNWIHSQRRKYRVARRHPTVVYDDALAILQGSRTNRTPEEIILAQEAERMLTQALQTLKSEQREVFILRMMQGLSVTETARILGIPEGTVKTHLYRSRHGLRTWLERHQWDNDGTEHR